MLTKIIIGLITIPIGMFLIIISISLGEDVANYIERHSRIEYLVKKGKKKEVKEWNL